MYLYSCQITGFMAFRETPEIRFQPGFNIIVGKNGVGKSAMLRVLKFAIESKPHKSVQTLPSPSAPNVAQSSALITYSLDKHEFCQALGIRRNKFWWPRMQGQSADLSLANLVRWINDNHEFLVTYHINGSPKLVDFFGFNVMPPHGDGSIAYDIHIVEENGEYRFLHSSTQLVPGSQDTVDAVLLQNGIHPRRYAFDAERPRIGTCHIGTSTVLKSDASNLPEVLHALSGNPRQYEDFNRLISSILPNVKWIEPRLISQSIVELFVWHVSIETRRRDLAVALSESGTGIGQVVAMLYVIFTVEIPMTIIIDEPQSFLHPSAIYSLIEVFREYPHNQYIIATHSPTVLSAARPCTVIQLSHDGNEAVVTQSSSEEVDASRAALNELGVRLADVFGADRILWVEGPTEEACFTRLLEDLLQYRMADTRILSVINTGDFQQGKAKHIRMVFSIYQKLTTCDAIFPPALGFLFDRENLTPQQMDDFRREAPSPVDFIERKMYECYLLDAEAITAVLNAEILEGPRIGLESVEAWMAKKKGEGEYLPPETRRQVEVTDDDWHKNVDAARLLKDLFSELSEQRLEYIKTRHSLLLTSWLIEYKGESLSRLAEFVMRFIESCRNPADSVAVEIAAT